MLKAEDPTLETRIAKFGEGAEGPEWSADTCTAAPRRLSVLVTASTRHLIDWICVVDPEQTEEFPITMVRQAMEVTSQADWDRQVDWYPGDNPVNARSHRSFKEAGLTQKQWIEACQQAPSKICFHLPSTLEKSIAQKLQTVVSDFYPDIVCTISQEPKQRTSSNWVVRFLWALQFHRQMDFRYAMFQGPGSCNGRRASGTYDFWLHGTPLSNLPSSNSMEPKNLCKDTYASVVNLLAERPWSAFAPYEALKVTFKMDTTETTRYVLFSDGECHFGHEKSNSPFGVMEILEDESSVTSRFGRRMMWAQSGFLAAPEQCPDRLFVTSESLSRVHYDSILLLEDLFGDSLLPNDPFDSYMRHARGLPEPKTLPAVGVIPFIEAQTGNIPGYPAEGKNRPCRVRCFTENEMTWLTRCSLPLQRFIAEEGSKCRASDGVTLRTYPLHVGDGQASVTISYNMDIAYGGLWNPDVKWMWFD